MIQSQIQISSVISYTSLFCAIHSTIVHMSVAKPSPSTQTLTRHDSEQFEVSINKRSI